MENKKKKNEENLVKKPSVFTNVLLSISFVSTIGYFIFTVIKSTNVISQLNVIISTLLMTIFSILFILISLNTINKKNNKFIIIAAILLTIYSGFNISTELGIIKLPTQKYVLNFTNKSMVDALKWGKENKIEIEQIYETSDSVKEYNVISQDIEPGTLVKDVKKLVITVSEGPNTTKEILIPNMIGWTADEVLAFIDKNYLTNVDVSFIVTDEEKDKVIEQTGTGLMKRNDYIKLVFSIGKEEEIVPVSMIDLTNKSTFNASFWLKQHGINYEEDFDYSDVIKRNYVMKQSISKGTEVDPKNDKVIITISKGNKIVVPDLMNMDMTSISEWITKNKLKIEFSDRYDDNIKLGSVIEASHKKDDVIEEGTLIKIVISKGQLKMPDFKSFNEYKEWADKYGIEINENQEFNDDIASGKIIKTSHKVGETLKNGDSITITTSQGKAIIIPDFVGKTISKIKSECNSLDISCNFTYAYSDSVKKDVAIKQSKTSGSKVIAGSSISITISKGAEPKITIPNFVGQTQASIQSKCNSLGIKCNFSTSSSFGGTKGTALSQSKIGVQSPGTVVNIVLARGAANSYNINIQPTWFGTTYNETVNNLKAKLERACPGVTFIYKPFDVNEGSGIISQNSAVKAGANTFIEGNTYTITINR